MRLANDFSIAIQYVVGRLEAYRNKHAMTETPHNLTYEIELQPGEKLSLPPALIESVGPGRWVVTVQPAEKIETAHVRRHDAFLNGYAPEDEGLYDDNPSG